MAVLDLRDAPYGGDVRLLPESATSLRIAPRLWIAHSIVGSAAGAYRYFRDATNLESTFIVTLGGAIWQLMDTTRKADANYRANPFALSVETEDRGDPDHDPWTDRQLEALAWLGRKCHEVHPAIKLQRAPTWDGSGYGYHTMFGAPGPWTPVSKTCPGRVRIRQFNEELLPAILTGETMALTAEDKDWLAEQIRFGVRWTDHGDNTVPGSSNNLAKVRGDIDGVDERLDVIEGKIDALAGAPPDSQVVTLNPEQMGQLVNQAATRFEQALEGLNLQLNPADRDAIATTVNGVLKSTLATVAQGAAAAAQLDTPPPPPGE